MLKGYGKEHAKFSAKLNYICLFTNVLCRGESFSVSLYERQFTEKSNNKAGFLNNVTALACSLWMR